MKYRAILLDETLQDGRLVGELFIDHQKICFESGDHFCSFPTSVAIIENGGTGGRTIFIKADGFPFVFTTTDPLFLKDPKLLKERRTKTKIEEIRKDRFMSRMAIYVAIGFFVCFLGAIYLFRGQIVESVADKMPYSLEQTLGRQYIKQLVFTGNLDTTSAAQQMLYSQAQKLTKVVGEGYDFQFYISNDEEINAFALPGGFLVFNKGMLKSAKSWEEVMGVMSHEIAHVTLKHHTRGIVSQLGWSTLLSYLLGDGGAMTDYIFGASASIERLSYSRDYESESDKKGVAYLEAANINPQGMVDFFKTLEAEKDSSFVYGIPEFLSSHPATENRIEKISSFIKDKKKDGVYIDLGDYETFKCMLEEDIEL